MTNIEVTEEQKNCLRGDGWLDQREAKQLREAIADLHAHGKDLYERATTAERELARVTVERDEALRRVAELCHFVDNNMTFYDVEPEGGLICTSGPNIPVLAAVSKRIWYHATDDQTSFPFSKVIDAAAPATLGEEREPFGWFYTTPMSGWSNDTSVRYQHGKQRPDERAGWIALYCEQT